MLELRHQLRDVLAGRCFPADGAGFVRRLDTGNLVLPVERRAPGGVAAGRSVAFRFERSYPLMVIC